MVATVGWVAIAIAIFATCVVCIRPDKRAELPGAIRGFATLGAIALYLSGSLGAAIELLAGSGLEAVDLRIGFWIMVAALFLLPGMLPAPRTAMARPPG